MQKITVVCRDCKIVLAELYGMPIMIQMIGQAIGNLAGFFHAAVHPGRELHLQIHIADSIERPEPPAPPSNDKLILN